MREQLIQALGLPAEATDEQILAAVGDMQQRLKDVEQAQLETQVENDLKEHEGRIIDRKAMKDALLKDRAGTLAILKAVKPVEAKPATTPVTLNGGKAKDPVSKNGGSDADRSSERVAFVEKVNKEYACRNRAQAWRKAASLKPELFND